MGDHHPDCGDPEAIIHEPRRALLHCDDCGELLVHGVDHACKAAGHPLDMPCSCQDNAQHKVGALCPCDCHAQPQVVFVARAASDYHRRLWMGSMAMLAAFARQPGGPNPATRIAEAVDLAERLLREVEGRPVPDWWTR